MVEYFPDHENPYPKAYTPNPFLPSILQDNSDRFHKAETLQDIPVHRNTVDDNTAPLMPDV